MPAKKVVSASASGEETAKVAKTESAPDAENKKLKAENAKLKKNIENMSAELEEVKKMIASLNAPKVATLESFSEEDVSVCSLCVGSLSVGTEKYGQGTIYQFNQFGEEQEIPFGDLRNIVRNNRSFAENGVFYIEDPDVVKKLRLASAYKRCLTADEMKNIMTQKPNDFVALYDRASDLQKENIIGLITEAKLKGQFVDANILSQIGQRSKKDLMNID